VFIRFVLLFVLVLALAAPAYVAPRVLFQRTRASKALSEAQRNRAHEQAKALARTTTPEELAKLLSGAPLAYRLYTAVAHVELREKVIDAYEGRIELLDRAHDLLDEYLEDVNQALKVNFDGDPGPPLPEPSPGPPEIVQTDKTLRVMRVLELPTPATTRARLRMLALAASADRDAIQAQQDKADDAEGTYLDVHRSWGAYLDDLADQVRRKSEGDMASEAESY